ncbi:MAG: hypothetical protein RQ864_10760 [Lutibacter sp.]|nr:hypothetical protein [Lutibacter sp.]
MIIAVSLIILCGFTFGFTSKACKYESPSPIPERLSFLNRSEMYSDANFSPFDPMSLPSISSADKVEMSVFNMGIWSLMNIFEELQEFNRKRKTTKESLKKIALNFIKIILNEIE